MIKTVASIAIASLVALIPVAWALMALGRKLDGIHLQVNSRMDALLAAMKKIYRAAGKKEGIAEERARNKRKK